MTILTLAIFLVSLSGPPALMPQDVDALVLSARPLNADDPAPLLNPAAPAWEQVMPAKILLNRTPPIYVGDPADDGWRPAAQVQLLRLIGDRVVVRLTWTDPAADEAGQGTAYPDAGADSIYKRHSGDTASFPDAAGIMIPARRGPGPIHPSLMMGDAAQPVEIVMWQAGRGFFNLTASGRGTTAFVPVGAQKAPVPGAAARTADGWSACFLLENCLPGSPVSFAVWDGARGQRSGLKYYSLWYEVR